MSDKLIYGNAYKIFVEEFSKHLKYAEEHISPERPPSDIEQDPALKEIGRHFHMVKGGAGFLGFPEISKRAADIEHYLIKSSESVISHLDQVRSLIDELKDLAEQLPEPGQTKPPGKG